MSRWSKLFLKFSPISMALISSSCIFNKPKVSQKEQEKAKNDSKIITKQLNSINDEIDSLFHSINNRKNVETASINNKVNQQVNEFNSTKNGATLSQLSELEKVNNIYKTELNSKKQELLNQRNWINLLKDDRDSLNKLKVRVNENKNKVNNYEFNAECTEQLARIDDLLESINSLIEQHEAIINETIALLDQIIDIFNRLEKDLENQKMRFKIQAIILQIHRIHHPIFHQQIAKK